MALRTERENQTAHTTFTIIDQIDAMNPSGATCNSGRTDNLGEMISVSTAYKNEASELRIYPDGNIQVDGQNLAEYIRGKTIKLSGNFFVAQEAALQMDNAMRRYKNDLESARRSGASVDAPFLLRKALGEIARQASGKTLRLTQSLRTADRAERYDEVVMEKINLELQQHMALIDVLCSVADMLVKGFDKGMSNGQAAR